jgi:uncharacterized protein (TIRG00374 family)
MHPLKESLNLPGGQKMSPPVPQTAAGALERLAMTETHKGTPMGLKKRWPVLLLASICLSLAVPLILGGLGQFELLRKLGWGAAILLTLLVLVSWAFNAVRTRFLMKATGRQVSFWDAALVTISAEFAGVTTPGAVGMPATYTFLFHNLGLKLGEAVGLVGLIVVTDLVFYGTLMPVAAVFQLWEGTQLHHAFRLVAVLLVVVAGGALALGLLVRHYRKIYHFISRQMAKVSWAAKRRYRLARTTVEFIHSVRILGRMTWPQRLTLYLITVGFWLPRYLVLVFIIFLVGKTVPFSYVFLVQGVLNLGGQMFILPGGGGTVEAGYVGLMSPYLGVETIAFTLLVWRTYTFYWYLIVGGPIFLFKTGAAARDLLIQPGKK